MAGFFQLSTVVSDKPEGDFPKCGRCKLNKHCESPKIPVKSEQRDLLFVGNPPSKAEDQAGKWMAGDSGEYLRNFLHDNSCPAYSYIGSLICHPKDLSKPLRNLAEHLRDCRPSIFNQVKQQKPKVVVLLGDIAIRAFLEKFVKDLGTQDLKKWHGWEIPMPSYKCFVIPTYGLVEMQEGFNKVRDSLFQKHIRRAIQIAKDGESEFKEMMSRHKKMKERISRFELLFQPKEIKKRIRDMMKKPITAFDYETTALKPEYDGARIVSVAISDGEETIAFPFPMVDGVADVFFDYLRKESCKKIGANIKFEDRMTNHFYGFKRKSVIRGWALDTNLCAHHFDCRRGITSVKFQAFVQLGIENYTKKVDQFLQAPNGQRINRIMEDISIGDLLEYNAKDALYEYHLGVKLAKLTGLYEKIWKGK